MTLIEVGEAGGRHGVNYKKYSATEIGMDVGGIASLATSMAAAQTNQDVGIAVLKKALDAQRAGAEALLNAIPSPAAANLPPHLGQNINTTA